jgi:ribosomal-protein-alanine N-acetyltransferase
LKCLGRATFIGFVGLSIPSFDAHFMPAVEVGWRIDKEYWGRGFATEAAHAAVADGFEHVGLAEIVSLRRRQTSGRFG